METNAEAVGLDMVHESNRHTSFNRSRDMGIPQITGPIVLVQDANHTPGFLFFAPIYEGPAPTNQAERNASFVGTVYAPFIVNKLIGGTLGQELRSTVIRITDGDEILYDEIGAKGLNYDSDTLARKVITMDLYGRQWMIDVHAGLDFRAANAPHQSTNILIAGIFIDLLLLTLFIFLTRANRRGLRFAALANDAMLHEATALKESNAKLAAARKEAEGVGEMKSRFLSTMSHEIRTPLTAISGILMLLDRAKLPKEQDGLVQAGKLASERLLKLLTDVLDMSKLEANAVQLWEREVPLRPAIEEWRLMTEGMVEKLGKNVTVNAFVADDFPQTVFVDDIRLTQVMNNLLDNAVRFTSQGSITISASAPSSANSSLATYVFTVIDTGQGVAEDELPDIFERFRQVDGSITRDKSGSGLGLAICYDLVHLLGGEIHVSSKLGMGSSFKVTLPALGSTSAAQKTDEI